MNGVDQFEGRWPEAYGIINNDGIGLISQGTADWKDYRASALVTIRLAASGGLAIRVQGMRRYYALLLCDDGYLRLVKARSGTRVLAELKFIVERDREYVLELAVSGANIEARVDGTRFFDVDDTDHPLLSGGVGLIVEDGCLSSDAVTVSP